MRFKVRTAWFLGAASCALSGCFGTSDAALGAYQEPASEEAGVSSSPAGGDGGTPAGGDGGTTSEPAAPNGRDGGVSLTDLQEWLCVLEPWEEYCN